MDELGPGDRRRPLGAAASLFVVLNIPTFFNDFAAYEVPSTLWVPGMAMVRLTVILAAAATTFRLYELSEYAHAMTFETAKLRAAPELHRRIGVSIDELGLLIALVTVTFGFRQYVLHTYSTENEVSFFHPIIYGLFFTALLALFVHPGESSSSSERFEAPQTACAERLRRFGRARLLEATERARRRPGAR